VIFVPSAVNLFLEQATKMSIKSGGGVLVVLGTFFALSYCSNKEVWLLFEQGSLATVQTRKSGYCSNKKVWQLFKQ
jgi:hypothetical protein